MAGDQTTQLLRAWATLGIAFDVTPARASPDLERLLLATARQLPDAPRLLPTVVTWLRSYGDAVARHRLRRLAVEELDRADQPALGLLLAMADVGARPPRFPTVLRALRPASSPQPLFAVQRLSPALADRARRRATRESRRWGVWAEPIEPRPDAVLAPFALMQRHPHLRLAIDLRGDLRASVLAALRHDPDAGNGESALARAAGGSRAQVRNALANLELTGRAARTRTAGVRRTRIAAVEGGARGSRHPA